MLQTKDVPVSHLNPTKELQNFLSNSPGQLRQINAGNNLYNYNRVCMIYFVEGQVKGLHFGKVYQVIILLEKCIVQNLNTLIFE